MDKKALMAEIKKRSWHGFYKALGYGFLFGVVQILNSYREVCSSSNPLNTFQCPSDGTQLAFGLLGGLLDLIIIGLPLGYLFYNDIKWKLLGYKPAAKGIMTNVLFVAIFIDALLPVYIDIPNWIGLTLFVLLYLWFIFSVIYYHALKKQYEEDKKNGKLPKLGIIEVLKKEKQQNEEVVKSNKISKSKDESSIDDTFDDGL